MKVMESRNYHQAVQQAHKSPAREKQLPIAGLRRRLHWLQWVAPAVMALAVVFYVVGPGDWIYGTMGYQRHQLAEILFFGTIGPVLIFILFNLLGRWLEEKETSELQALVLAQAREHARISHEVTDDALQAIFAASVMLNSLESSVPNLPPEVIAQLRQTNRAMDPIMQQLYAHQAKQNPVNRD
jgi:signal transduction histidine kinase